MTRFLPLLLLFGLAATSTAAEPAPTPPRHPYVEIITTEGRILLELDGRAAPYTVDHFLSLVDAGFYDGLVFHRVIDEFVIQGGGYTPGLELREDEQTIPNESGNGWSNVRGTIAMARTADPHSANAQFYINVGDNVKLDPAKRRWGYTVFGFVIEGMDVVDRIAAVPTGPQKGMVDVPQVPVVIKKIARYTFEMS